MCVGGGGGGGGRCVCVGGGEVVEVQFSAHCLHLIVCVSGSKVLQLRKVRTRLVADNPQQQPMLLVWNK